MNKLTKTIGAVATSAMIIVSTALPAAAEPSHRHRDHHSGDGAGIAAGIATGIAAAIILNGIRDHPHDRVRPWDNPRCRDLRHRCDRGHDRACRKFRRSCTYRH